MNLPAKKDRAPAWYALRRTLPPWRFEETLSELVACLGKYRVDELIIKIDTEEFSHGQPSLEWVKAYQKNLLRVRDEMLKLGVVYSLNPWVTLGHVDRGRDLRKALPGLRTLVGHDGTECTANACPLSTVWREHISKVWTLYAQTQPNVIWVEDDIRTFNHPPARYGCFCPEHLNAFSQRVGKAVTREEVVAAILKPGQPHPWRAEYLTMQADIMVQTAAMLGQAVHKASPQTHMGLMSSGPNFHVLEGRRWREFADALADGVKLYSRPPMYNYNEDSLRELYLASDAIKSTRYVLPGEPIEQSELDNGPWGPYSKGPNFTYLKLAITFAQGCDGVTMNLFEHLGTPMEGEPQFGRLLADKKDKLNGLAQRSQETGSYRGVQVLFDERLGILKHLPADAPYGALAGDGFGGVTSLESLGVPTIYEDSPIVLASGQSIRALPDEKIRKLLSRGLYLDAVATKILFDRGFGELIGVKDMAEPTNVDLLDSVFSAEEFFNPDFGGAKQKFMTLTMPSFGPRMSFSILTPADGAQVISRVVDPDAKPTYPAMIAFENSLGGRVIVQAIDLNSAVSVAYLNRSRLEQVHAVIRWASRDTVPMLLTGGTYPLAFRKDIRDRSVITLINLSPDPWPNVEFDLAAAGQVEKVELLGQNGQWRESPDITVQSTGSRVLVRYGQSVPFYEPIFITLYWK